MPMPDFVPSFIAWWGAGLSTLLAAVKLWELWRDRFHVEVSYNFGGPVQGNAILIRNLTSRPMILAYWELLYGSGNWPRRKFADLKSPDPEDIADIRIEPHSTCSFTFSGDHHFEWGASALKGRSIWLRLHVAGRRPFLRKVYP